MKNISRNTKLAKALSLVDDKYIAEADPAAKKLPLKTKRPRPRLLAACLCGAILLLGLWAFIPYDTTPASVAKHSSSEYYEIIQLLNEATFKKPKYDNNFDMLMSGLVNVKMEMATDADFAPTYGAAEGEYVEVTDNQTAGVTEADRIKRSDKYIYYLNGEELEIYEINGADTAKISSVKIEYPEDMARPYTDEWEFYLSSDCSTVTVIVPYYNSSLTVTTALISLDVRDPQKVSTRNVATVSGSYISSRVKDGKLILVSLFAVNSPDFSDESSFIPQINTGEGNKSIDACDIVYPETVDRARYTVVSMFDESTLALMGSTAFLSYSEEIYVSEERIYAVRSYTDVTEEDGLKTSTDMTDVTCLTFNDALETGGTFTVEGTVNDRFSLDEYNGILRIVTTTSQTVYKQRNGLNVHGEEYVSEMLVVERPGTSASLYCIDLLTGKTVASVINFAPKGESVRSARFDKNTAYVCTSVQLTDPVFFFDLTDLNNITYKDTGTIDGFSTTLISLGDGYLMGIGVGSSWNSLKIEIYEEGKTTVDPLCAYEMAAVYYSSEYKSYFIDREKRLIGLGYNGDGYNGYNEGSKYLLLMFDGYELKVLINTSLDGNNAYKRAVLIDGYFHMFGKDGIKTEKLFY